MNAKITLLTENKIRDWVGTASFQKGEQYFKQGAIFETYREGDILKGRCHGSREAAYRVEATLGSSGIDSTFCSCPVGSGGYCKHVAALLLTWLQDPMRFKEIETLAERLEKHSKEELIVLIQQIVRRAPDLELLLDLPLLGKNTADEPLDEQAIRRQAEHAFSSSDNYWEMGWNDTYEMADELQILLELAEGFNSQNNSIHAASVYRIVAEIILKYSQILFQDENGHLGSVLHDCVDGLEECLKSIQDPVQRSSIFKILFDINLADLEVGGIGISDGIEDIFLEQTTSEERKNLADWCERNLPELGGWGKESMGGLLLMLQADELDDETYLEVCRRTGRLEDMVERLLILQRIESAVKETEQASDYNLIRLADLFVEHGQEMLAETLIVERTKVSQDIRLTIWLKDKAKDHNDLNKALGFAEKIFWQRPSVTPYMDLRQIALSIDRWEGSRAEILEKLVLKAEHSLLTEIFMEEDEIDLMLQHFEEAAKSPYYWNYSSLTGRVANKAKEKRPRDSIKLYLQLGENLIDRRGRGNYVGAVDYLKTIRDIYTQIGDIQGWQLLITKLREEYRNLPAFQDELKKAGL